MGKVKHRQPHHCNFLVLQQEKQHFFQFDVDGFKVKCVLERQDPVDTRLPSKLVNKDWHALWLPELNLAWVSPEQIFFRVLHLPASDQSELQQIIELQLEKISPIPVAQIVWSFQVVNSVELENSSGSEPQSEPQPQENSAAEASAKIFTVVIVIVARQLIESKLERFEAIGYEADNLCPGILYELMQPPQSLSGANIYPIYSDANSKLALVAWWNKGTLHDIGWLNIPSNEKAASELGVQISQYLLAGELAGWLPETPEWTLIGDTAAISEWLPLLNNVIGDSVKSQELAPLKEMSERNVIAIVKRELTVNLVPDEFQQKYKHQFIDRLWMRGVGALVGLYVFGVLVYLVALQVLNIQKMQLEARITSLKPQFETAQQLKSKIQILQTQANLKYAALDCWKAVAEKLPQELTVTSLSFQRGKVLQLTGTFAQDQVGKVMEFNQSLASYEVNGTKLFKKINPPSTDLRQMRWSFDCELNSTEIE